MCDHSNVKQIITRWREPTSTSHNTFILHTFTPQVAFQIFPVYFNHLNLHITATMLCWLLSDDFSETFIVSWQGLIIVCVGDFKSSKNAWHGDWQNILPQVDLLDSPLVLARPFSYHHHPEEDCKDIKAHAGSGLQCTPVCPRALQLHSEQSAEICNFPTIQLFLMITSKNFNVVPSPGPTRPFCIEFCDFENKVLVFHNISLSLERGYICIYK